VQKLLGTNLKPIMQTNDLAITYIPLYTALFAGKATISEIGVKDIGSSPEFVNISIGRTYSNLITLSTNSVYLQPNSTLYMQFVLNAYNNSADIATYNIPINFSINPLNGEPSTVTENIALTISSVTSEQPRLLNEVTLINSTNSITGMIEIRSGTNASINNATLMTTFTASVSDNISSIGTYGLQAKVVRVDGAYRIYWLMPYLPPGQVQYAYYQIEAMGSQQQFPSHIQNILTIPSMLKPINLIKIINFSLPTIYTSSTETISADVLYTGTSAQNVYFYLTAPPGTTVYNSTQVVNATPNQLLSRQFTLKTGNSPGTLMFTLYINTQGANMTYSLPIVVLQKPGIVTQTGNTINTKDLAKYIEIIGAVLLIGLLIYSATVILNRPRYNPERARRLANTKDQIDKVGH
jgi:hypothetical protein